MEDSQAKKQKSKHNATPGSSVPSTPESVNLGDDDGPYGFRILKQRSKNQNIMHAFIISFSTSSFHKRAGPRTIANRAWSTPNARSTSFLADS